MTRPAGGQPRPDPDSVWVRWERRRLAAEDRQRMRENLGALAAVIVLLVVGFWLIDRLGGYSRNLACIEARHRSCP